MSDSTYGHRRIQAQPHCWGVTVGLTLVRRLMRELGLEPHR
ncbi:IS3 family transposase [Streptomyces scopuliridis]